MEKHILLAFALLTLDLAAQPLRMGYGGPVSAYDITDCDNGNHVLCSGGTTILRIHSDGSLVWAKTIQTQGTIVGATETLSGELLVALNANNPDSGYFCPALVRLASDGSFISGQYLHFANPPVRAQRFLRSSVNRHVLLLRSEVVGLPMAALVCFTDAGVVQWALAPAGGASARFNEMSVGPGAGVLVFDHDDYTGVIMSVSVVGVQQWARVYGIGAQEGGVIYDAAMLPGSGGVDFLARGASTEDPWGSFLVMRTDMDGVPAGSIAFDHGADTSQLGGSIDANFSGDRIISLNYGSSDELLMKLNSTDSIAWVKHNANNVQQFGGTARFVNGGNTFTHVVNVNEYPGVRYFRSDATSEVAECYEDLALTTMQPPTIDSDVLDFPLGPTSFGTTDYVPIVEDVAVEQVLPCIAQDVLGPVARTGPALWPVPAADQVRVSGMVPGQLVIRDALGRYLRSVSVTDQEQAIPVADLAAGAYLLDVPTERGIARLHLLK